MQYNSLVANLHAQSWGADQGGLVLKWFRRLPLADLEMVLPDKRVFVPPSAHASLLTILGGGLAAAASALMQVRASRHQSI